MSGMENPAGQPLRDLGQDRQAAAGHLADDAHHLVGDHVLQEVGDRACIERAIDVLVPLVSGEHDDLRRGELAADGANCRSCNP
jgi:hypothetical protein